MIQTSAITILWLDSSECSVSVTLHDFFNHKCDLVQSNNWTQLCIHAINKWIKEADSFISVANAYEIQW